MALWDKIKGIRKGFTPKDTSKAGKLGKENLHRRTNSCFEILGGAGAVQPLAERHPNNLPLSDRNCLTDERRYKVIKSEEGASTDFSARSDTSHGSGRGSNKLSTHDSSKTSTGRRSTSRVTSPQPFRLLTEKRGQVKEQQFMRKLRLQMEEEEKLRIPIAQWLPLTTDEPQVLRKPPVKEQTMPLNIKLHTEYRASERAEFDHFVDEKLSFLEQQRQEKLRLKKLAEEEEIKRLREEMIPHAQVMPFFDQPFIPKKSTKPPTVAKEPKLHSLRRPRSFT